MVSEEMRETARERMREVYEWQDRLSDTVGCGCTDSACSHHQPYQDERQPIGITTHGVIKVYRSEIEDAVAMKKATACSISHDFVVGSTHAVCNRCEKVIVLPAASLGKPIH